MDDYGNEINYLTVWKQYIGTQCGEFNFFNGDYWPLWSEQ